jgi:tRNA(Ile)-lysidine synthase
MASTAKPRAAERPDQAALARFDEQIADLVPHGAKVCVALSGGIDSVVLLDLLTRSACRGRWSLQALHVHHGISPNADQWADFCRRLCRRRGLPLEIVRVDLSADAHLGLEGAAREARLGAFARIDATVVALAHHADDQAETVLLQLLRGSGLAGLAAMPLARPVEGADGRSRLLVRPLLGWRRAEIARYARSRRLRWVEDESNEDRGRARNLLRHEVLPRLQAINPRAVENIGRSAAHLASALQQIGAQAREDAGLGPEPAGVQRPGEAVVALPLAPLRALDEVRALQALRAWMRQSGLRPPSTAQLREFWQQLARAHAGARVSLSVQGVVLRRHRDRLLLEPVSMAVPGLPLSAPLAWDGRRCWVIEALGGTLEFEPACGRGIARRHLEPSGRLAVVPRPVGRFRPCGADHGSPLKDLFQALGVPHWQRATLPYVAIDGVLAWVPGPGVGADWAAGPDEEGMELRWVSDRRG